HAAWRDDTQAPGHAVWLPDESRLISASDDAWRYLGWQYLDATGQISRLPLETFGECCAPPVAMPAT
ncbi:MAG: hypothetical protein K2Q10_12600, partial [Rhodospirillales bacterium]|nr:hypothetical protein [Rhodospirillales bacterium]